MENNSQTQLTYIYIYVCVCVHVYVRMYITDSLCYLKLIHVVKQKYTLIKNFLN